MIAMLSPETLGTAAAAGLTVSDAHGVVHLHLARPGGNRFSHALLESLHDTLVALAAAPGLRCGLLTAAGSDFSFGADLADPAMAAKVAGSRADRETLAELGRRALDAWATLPVPTVAAGQGKIVGAGACFFCTADFAFAAAEASVQFPEVDRGMHLSWGAVPRLVGRFGLAHATHLALTGERVPCRELPQPPLRISSAPREEAHALAARLAAKPPLAVRAIKRVLIEAAEPLQTAAVEDAALFADTIASEDFAEAMAAWFDKRPGVYQGK